MPVNKVFDTAMVMLTKFQQKFPGHGPKLKQSPARWKPPTIGELKANFDGAVFVNTGEAGIGVVIRNEFGEVMAALSEKNFFSVIGGNSRVVSSKKSNRVCSGTWLTANQF